MKDLTNVWAENNLQPIPAGVLSLPLHCSTFSLHLLKRIVQTDHRMKQQTPVWQSESGVIGRAAIRIGPCSDKWTQQEVITWGVCAQSHTLMRCRLNLLIPARIQPHSQQLICESLGQGAQWGSKQREITSGWHVYTEHKNYGFEIKSFKHA